jgi:uncharacterized membrane protein affecting hemolysin expression
MVGIIVCLISHNPHYNYHLIFKICFISIIITILLTVSVLVILIVGIRKFITNNKELSSKDQSAEANELFKPE